MAFKMQKRCIRSMFGLNVTDSCKPLFTKHNIPTLPSLYIFEMALFVKLNPILFPRLSDKNYRNRRNKNLLCIHPAKTTLLQKSIICMAPKIYNKIPDVYKNLNTNLFRKKLKMLLIDKCYYNIDEFLNDNL